MPIKPVDLDKLKHQSSNIYEVTVAMSRRAKEINEQLRSELEEKLAPFKMKSRNPTNEAEADRVFPEQVGISIRFEKLPKPTVTAIEELLEKKYTFDYRDTREGGRKSKN
ncbi:MAG: DNA-directed RNA polymerase subunit omega [Chloroherpetonaceae bacterium]